MKRKNCEHAYLPFPFLVVMHTFQVTLTRYYKSFVGRDLRDLQFTYHHRVWMMVEEKVWFKLSKVSADNTCNSYMFMHYMCQQVFRIAYCQPFDPEMVGSYESDCSSCVTAILAHFPNLKRKLN